MKHSWGDPSQGGRIPLKSWHPWPAWERTDMGQWCLSTQPVWASYGLPAALPHFVTMLKVPQNDLIQSSYRWTSAPDEHDFPRSAWLTRNFISTLSAWKGNLFWKKEVAGFPANKEQREVWSVLFWRKQEGIRVSRDPSKKGSQELLARNKCYEDFIILSNTIHIWSFYFQLSEVIRRKTSNARDPETTWQRRWPSGVGES